MATWCKKRMTTQDLLVRFGDGKHRFYLESVCAEPVFEGNLCRYCLNVTAQTRTQDVKTFPHGLVGCEYPEVSHIFDSPWYHKKVKAYGEPSKADVELAMEAQTKARAGTKTKSVAELTGAKASDVSLTDTATVPVPTQEAVVEKAIVNEPVKEKKARGRKPKAATEEEKPKKPRAKKAAAAAILEEKSEPLIENAANVVATIPPTVTHVESMDDPIVVREIINVCLKPFSHDGSSFWRDQEREKLYKRSKDGKKGEYVGRWDSAGQRIVRDAPDSDVGECV